MKMDKEKLDELWKQVEHIGKVERLNYDAMVSLGSVFGQMRSAIEEIKKENWALHQEIGGYAGRIEALIEEFDMLTGRMKLLKTQMFNPK
jgi:uncharacterized coiled-coil DUF342 family protein